MPKLQKAPMFVNVQYRKSSDDLDEANKNRFMQIFDLAYNNDIQP